MKKPPFKSFKKVAPQADSNAAKAPPKREVPKQLKAHAFQPGNKANPAGRPIGSRNKFSEKFLQDFHKFWVDRGTEVFEKTLRDDPGVLIRVAGSMVPKDFNLNTSNTEDLEALLEKYSLEQLKDLAAGLAAVGATQRKPVGQQARVEENTGAKPDSVH